jgi:hypothetical protein
VQTFLPYPDFAESASVLDTARLGKQRVEALQVLRAIVLPSYGWQTHPAMQMWRGYVPALTRYALAMVDEWTGRDHPDTTRPLITEFAPEAATGAVLAVPSWLGNEALHVSHRSNLIRKAPEFYSRLFPGVPGDLPYVWPGPDPIPAAEPVTPPTAEPGTLPTPLSILRPRTPAEFDDWTSHGAVTFRELSPRGTRTPKWTAQLEAFRALHPGTPVAVLAPDGASLVLGTVTDTVVGATDDTGEPALRLPVAFTGDLPRSAFPYPALLQDPRTLFTV